MSDIFISYVEEDSEIATQIAVMLEAAGYTTWSYESNGLPGHDFISQITQEITAAKAMILLISVQAMSSHHVATELFQAYSNNKHVIPLLLGIKYDEVKKRQPNWATMLGAAVSVPIDSASVGKVAPRVIKSLETKGIWPSVRKTSETATEKIPARRKSAKPSRDDNKIKRKRKKLVSIGTALALFIGGTIIAVMVVFFSNGTSSDNAVNNHVSNPDSTVEYNATISDNIVTFQDLALESVIRQNIGKSYGTIYQSDVENMTYLDMSEKNISNLNGLGNCVGLTEVRLMGNQISDISEISSLTNLQYLYLSYNNISDISPLSDLNDLRALYISNNAIHDVSALSNLTNLKTIYLSYNTINDISPLSGLINLITLQISHNQISSIKPLIDNSGISNGDIVALFGNLLDTTSTSNYIPQLEARGVLVSY